MRPSNISLPAVPAATVVILRDRPDGMEVFMIVRRHSIDFASGALVFPGGKVEASDADPTWAEFAPLDAAPAERANIVAAARETFEEAGLVQGVVIREQRLQVGGERRVLRPEGGEK